MTSLVKINNSLRNQKFKRQIVQTAVVQKYIHHLIMPRGTKTLNIYRCQYLILMFIGTPLYERTLDIL